ncbi:MAG: ACP S-malonyltransferase [Deltaproteobacteria bacterium]|nr:ACP S-malonyltransferase [Deltaproteobacteria bacterium]
MTLLVDLNVEGHAVLLSGTLAAAGWLELLPLRFVRLVEMNLPYDSTDRVIWRFAQANQMYLLTDNRNMEGDDSLEQTIREENLATSLPVLTISRSDQMMNQSYREACATRLLEVLLYPERYFGVGRLFI